VVGEPFLVTCTLRDFRHDVDDIDSSMLEFCIQHPNSSVVTVADHAHVVNRSSAQLVYTLHLPTRNVGRTMVMCFLKNSSSARCSGRNKRTVVLVGCK